MNGIITVGTVITPLTRLSITTRSVGFFKQNQGNATSTTSFSEEQVAVFDPYPNHSHSRLTLTIIASFLAVCVDQTGVGEYIVEEMKSGGISGVQGILLTLPRKEEILTFLKQKMINRQVAVPYEQTRLNERFVAQLNVEKFEITKEGRIKFSHPSGTHDDMLWAFALAVYATKKDETGVILF